MSPSRRACWNRFLPVGLMRSPTTVMPSTVTKSIGEQSTEGMAWAGRPGLQSAKTLFSSLMKSGVVPQQPPAAKSFKSR